MPLYPTNTGQVYGGPARWMITASSYVGGAVPHPGNVSQFVNVSTYAPNVTYGWVDLGNTENETTITREFDITAWRSQQVGEFRRKPRNARATISATLMETHQANKTRLFSPITNANTDPSATERMTSWVAATSLEYKRLAVGFFDDDNRWHWHYFPKVQWAGAPITQAISDENPATLTAEFAAFADDTLIDPVSGRATFERDIEQVP